MYDGLTSNEAKLLRFSFIYSFFLKKQRKKQLWSIKSSLKYCILKTFCSKTSYLHFEIFQCKNCLFTKTWIKKECSVQSFAFKKSEWMNDGINIKTLLLNVSEFFIYCFNQRARQLPEGKKRHLPTLKKQMFRVNILVNKLFISNRKLEFPNNK